MPNEAKPVLPLTQDADAGPATSATLYARYLTPQQRRGLYKQAQEAGRTAAFAAVKGDIRNLADGVEPARDDDGQLHSLKMARKYGIPHQLNELDLSAGDAEAKAKAIKPLDTMHRHDVLDYVRNLAPKESLSPEDYRRQAIVYDAASKHLAKLEKDRETDPALSVAKHPEVGNMLHILGHSGHMAILENDEGGNIHLSHPQGDDANATTADPIQQRARPAGTGGGGGGGGNGGGGSHNGGTSGLYGGGGGGASLTGGTASSGSQGIIVVTYDALAPAGMMAAGSFFADFARAKLMVVGYRWIVDVLRWLLQLTARVLREDEIPRFAEAADIHPIIKATVAIG